MALVGNQRPDLVDTPNMVLVRVPTHGFAGLGIASISQFSVAIYGMVAAPLQFAADCRLAGARNTFDQIVSDPH